MGEQRGEGKTRYRGCLEKMGSRCLQIPLKELCLADGIPGIAGSAGSAGIGCFTDYPA